LEDFAVYAHAFHQAGNRLALHAFSGDGYSDADACPILYLYRHALELYFKAIALTGIKIAQIDGEEHPEVTAVVQNHALAPHLAFLQNTFERVGWTWGWEQADLRTFDDVKRMIAEIDHVDGGSFSFRYPVKRGGREASLSRGFLFHMPTLCSRLDSLLDALDAADTGLEAEYELRVDGLMARRDAYDSEPGNFG